MGWKREKRKNLFAFFVCLILSVCLGSFILCMKPPRNLYNFSSCLYFSCKNVSFSFRYIENGSVCQAGSRSKLKEKQDEEEVAIRGCLRDGLLGGGFLLLLWVKRE